MRGWPVLEIGQKIFLDEPARGYLAALGRVEPVHHDSRYSRSSLDKKLRLGMDMLATVVKHMDGQLTLQDALRESLAHICRLVSAPGGWIYLTTENGGFELSATYGLPSALAVEMGWGPCSCQRRLSAASGRLEDISVIPCQRLNRAAGDGCYRVHHASIPLRRDGEDLGILNVAFRPAPVQLTTRELAILAILGDVLAMVVQRAQMIRAGRGSGAKRA